ncbi:hypothetical protein [Posidoniimonas polymericola]|nr:hypothetical protein [Posidoniimonas polymericola]
MLKVDFGTPSSPVDTANGFVGVDHTGALGLNGGSVGGTIGLTFGSSNPPVNSSNKNGPDALNRDFVSTVTGSNSANDYLEIMLSGVNPGTYSFTGYFHLTDPSTGGYANASTEVRFSDSVTTSPTLADLTVIRSEGNETPAFGSFDFSTVGGNISFLVELTNPTNRSVLINGFTLAAVPEVGSFLVWSGLFGVGMVRYRGKRKA